MTESHVKVSDVTRADINKIHAEINQYINQVMIITNQAITLFAIVIGYVVTGLSATKDAHNMIHAQPVSLLLPTALLILLVVMLFYCQSITRQHNVLSVYLILYDYSNWESDYQKFAPNKSLSKQNHFHLNIFGFLGLLTFIIPGIILWAFPPETNQNSGSWETQMTSITAIFVLISVIAISIFSYLYIYKDTTDYRESVKHRWESIRQPLNNQ